MGKDIRHDKPWGRGKSSAKKKRNTVKTGLQQQKKYKKSTTQSNDHSKTIFDDYVDPDDGFEKFENR